MAAGSDGTVVKITVQAPEAAAMLGMSLSSFKRHVQPELRCIYVGNKRLYRIAELDRWAQRNEASTATDRRLKAA